MKIKFTKEISMLEVRNVTKKFIKKNKMTVIVVICCLILTILIFALKLTFFPNEEYLIRNI